MVDKTMNLSDYTHDPHSRTKPMRDLDRTPRTEVTPQMIDECKRDLPPVRVLFNGNEWWGRVSGRKNQFASVYPHTRPNDDGTTRTIMGPITHFSWLQVCRAVVSGVPLHCDDTPQY
jgi:hypothetical protein